MLNGSMNICCRKCGSPTRVNNSYGNGEEMIRFRFCPACGSRYKTVETIQEELRKYKPRNKG